MSKCINKKSWISNKRSNLLLIIAFGVSLFTLVAHGEEPVNEFANQKKQKMIAFKKEPSMMIDFTEQKSTDNWRITNDDVMGGKSEGRFLSEQDKGVFSGYISLENKGGFSSVYLMVEPLSKGIETVTIDVEGDGMVYQLRMTVNLDGYRLAYKHNFNTVVGKRETFTFRLSDFQASFRGRIISDAPVLKSEEIRQVGFLVTKKVAGTFSLSVFSVNI
jgi:hypothetical protein